MRCIKPRSPASAQKATPSAPGGTNSPTSATAIIKGTVVLPSGHPVGNSVRLTLSTPQDPGQVTYTDNEGTFIFKDLAEGNYTLEAAGDTTLFKPVSQTVKLLRNFTVVLRINLEEKDKPATAKTASSKTGTPIGMCTCISSTVE